MYPVSREFLAALRSSHTVAVRATAYRGGAVVPGGEDLAVTGGSIRVESRSAVRRKLEGLQIVAPDRRTATARVVLDEVGTELQIWRGIEYPNGRRELAPVGRFIVESVDDALGAEGVVTVTGSDRATRIVDDQFLTPRAATAGLSVALQITQLIQETIPDVSVFDESESTATVPDGIVWERNRWEAIDSLAQSIGCEVYADVEGHFHIAPVSSLWSFADWTITTGARGVLIGGQRSTTRDGVYNVVVATSSPTDGTEPVVGIARDTTPGSPTNVDGPFGRVPRFYSSPLLSTEAQARSAAASILARSLGRRGTLTLETLVNPALDAGDRIDVLLPTGGAAAHIVDSFALPLGPTESMSIETRSTAPVIEESA